MCIIARKDIRLSHCEDCMSARNSSYLVVTNNMKMAISIIPIYIIIYKNENSNRIWLIVQKLRKLVFSGLFSAIICVATLVVQIPAPMNGYLNLGDSFVLLSGFVLGPVYGFCAASIGSALADIISGYSLYAPATFLIKGFVAVLAFYIFTIYEKIIPKGKIIGRIAAAIIAELFMVFGYFVCAFVLFREGLSAAISTIPGNLLQAAAAIIVAVPIYEVLKRVKISKVFFDK